MAKFDYGERTGQKYDAVQVALDMRYLDFSPELKKKKRNGKLSSGDNSLTADSQEEEMDGEDNGEEGEERRNLRSHIIREINVTRPIFYDSYDLCALHRGKKLSVFKRLLEAEFEDSPTGLCIQELMSCCGEYEASRFSYWRSEERKWVELNGYEQLLEVSLSMLTNKVLQLLGQKYNVQSKSAVKRKLF
ncbi:Hypothetical predicted protein [Paramuricea clavata]|uniref:Uncharacterized protein n=1 Tax=Paramuricea clavata TaxID=317549 RepID=A0A6S7FWF4_PARCT|nr:Hypothetical predicted protein [Paramuricea clavata]